MRIKIQLIQINYRSVNFFVHINYVLICVNVYYYSVFFVTHFQRNIIFEIYICHMFHFWHIFPYIVKILSCYFFDYLNLILSCIQKIVEMCRKESIACFLYKVPRAHVMIWGKDFIPMEKISAFKTPVVWRISEYLQIPVSVTL
jgi:hypothetical protein